MCELEDIAYELDYFTSFRSLSKSGFTSANVLVISTPFSCLPSTCLLLSHDFMFYLFLSTGISAVITSSTVMAHRRVREGKVH